MAPPLVPFAPLQLVKSAIFFNLALYGYPH